MPRDVGFSTCLVCDAKVMVRENANGAAYYKCNGHYDDNRKACGSEVKFGVRDSRALIEKLDAESKDAIHEKPAGPRKVEPQPRDPAESDDGHAPKTPAVDSGKRKPLFSFIE